jgi:spore maturation protein CgeB
MLTILNGGRMSRNWLIGMGNAASAMGLRHAFIEVDAIRQGAATDSKALTIEFNKLIQDRKIGLVLSYANNGAVDLPVDRGLPGAYRNFFEIRGIPQCFLWADHPHWVADKAALNPIYQPVARSANQFHFLKSHAHAYEITRILGWPNCHELPCAADPEFLKPVQGIESNFDVIAIYGKEGATLPDWLLPFLDQQDPNPTEINQIVAKNVAEELSALWQKESHLSMQKELQAWSARAIQLKLAAPQLALSRHIGRLSEEFPTAMWWLTACYPVYFKAAAILYAFRSWQRHFYLAYLSRYFHVGLFGAVWSHVGRAEDQAITKTWVDFAQIPSIVARGKVAFDIVAGWDEEGLTAKTFELAACGSPMIHNDCVGLAESFETGKEIEVFSTPLQARNAVQKLLDDPKGRVEMGHACRQRLLKEHTWGHRITRLFELARIPINLFRQ